MISRESWLRRIGGFVLVLLCIAVLAAFYVLFERTRRSVERERAASVEFLGEWYALKADLAALAGGLEGDGDGLAARAAAKLAGGSARFEAMADSPVLRAFRGGPAPRGGEEPNALRRDWAAISSAAEELLRSRSAGRIDLAPYRAIAARAPAFEAGIASRVAAIDRSGEAVRSSLSAMEFFIAVAILALAILAIRASYAARIVGIERTRLRALVASTLRAQEAERKRIALELHDTVAQELAAASMRASCLPDDPGAHREAVERSLRAAIEELRELAWEMRPPALERFGFYGAAAQYCREFGDASGIELDLSRPAGAPPELPDDTAIGLYRILQEALANVRRHSGATRARVAIELAGRTIVMRIEDEGAGFDPAGREAGPGHQGLSGMEERARFMGGSLEVSSAPGSGTVVTARVPLG